MDSTRYFRPRLTHIENFLPKRPALALTFACYDDAMDFILKLRDDGDRSVILDEIGNKYFDKLLNQVISLPETGYTVCGHGRALIADEMGLGKTPCRP